jgi:hypothetical protein
MDIGAIVTELGTALSAANINTYAAPPASGQTPAVVVNAPRNIEYMVYANGKCQLTIPVTLYVLAGDLGSSWVLLYKLLSSDLQGFTTLPDALLNHQPTSYTAVQVTTASNFQAYQDNGTSADITLIIKS